MTMPASPSRQGETRDPLLQGCGVFLLILLVLRCVTPLDPFPYWSADPLVQAAPVLGFTPASSLLVDVLTILTVCIAFARMGKSLGRLACYSLLAVMVPGCVIAWHASTGRPDATDSAVQGWNWIASLTIACGLATLATRDARLRALTIATLAGLVGVLAVRGAMQVFVEHPQSLASFRSTRDQFFAAQGWTPDSPMAKAFVRRLEQPEATGWFGYANVFATLAASGATVLAGLLLHAVRSNAPRSQLVVLAFATGAGALGVVLAGSKGGYAALALGLVLLTAAPWLSMRAWRTRWLGPALIVGVLFAVALRGLVGSRLSELSLLFRWFYMKAAVGIFGEHPLLGVGPSGGAFKDAYLLAKDTRSPEEISSPHNLPLEWLATLGIAGVGLVVLWIFSLLRAGQALRPLHDVPEASMPPDFHRNDARHTATLLTLIFVVPTMIAGLLEREGAVAETAIVRLGGCFFAIFIGRTALECFSQQELSTWVRRALAAGAMCAAVHCCIELTGVVAGANAWCMTLLGVAAVSGVQHKDPVVSRPLRFATLAICMVVLWCVSVHTLRTIRWEHQLKLAYYACTPAREQSQRFANLQPGQQMPRSGDGQIDTPERLARDLSDALSRPVAPTGQSMHEAMRLLTLAAAKLARTPLERARQLDPGHLGVLRAFTRNVMIQLGGSQNETGKPIAVLIRDAAFNVQPQLDGKSQYWVLRASTCDAMHTMIGDPASVELLEQARSALERAWELSPYEWQITQRLSDLSLRLGDAPAAQLWAQRSLQQDGLLTLDPIKRMAPAQRALLESRAKP
jgi:O-antigen ligase